MAIATPAMAESGWDSYWQGVLPIRNTRTWADHNIDRVHTTAKFRYCTYESPAHAGPRTVELQLTQETPWYKPDKDKGHHIYHCNTSRWQSHDFGRMPPSNYHLSLVKVDGLDRAPDRLNVGSPKAHGMAVNY